MGDVDTDKLKQLLYAMIETLDGKDSEPSQKDENPSPTTNQTQSQPQQTNNNQPRRSRYGGGENLFLSMPEKDMHKNDVEIDKKLAPKQLTARNRRSTEVDVRCRVCGKQQTVSQSLVTDGVHRYKCNDCSRSSG
tara:strand:+ start:382 stop:786 length:405 start_codon:yes stop_codon:yes gene_type:complete